MRTVVVLCLKHSPLLHAPSRAEDNIVVTEQLKQETVAPFAKLGVSGVGVLWPGHYIVCEGAEETFKWDVSVVDPAVIAVGGSHINLFATFRRVCSDGEVDVKGTLCEPRFSITLDSGCSPFLIIATQNRWPHDRAYATFRQVLLRTALAT